MLNFVYLRSSRLKFSHFWLDSCIVNKGGGVELEMACYMHLEGFQVVSSYFFSFGSFPGGIGLSGDYHLSDRCGSQVLGDLAHQSNR
jgi:hypothetical protein